LAQVGGKAHTSSAVQFSPTCAKPLARFPPFLLLFAEKKMPQSGKKERGKKNAAKPQGKKKNLNDLRIEEGERKPEKAPQKEKSNNRLFTLYPWSCHK
jgi:hypothetical protein